ncbi:MAG: ATP-binding protein [Nitrospirota bacterium]|nr:ATP-binding protein [Nitrospirota bacterium]
MKIREKIFLGVGTYIFLASIVGLFAYRELLTIKTRLHLVEIADDITHNIGEVRRYEKNFLLYREQEDFQEVKNYLGTLKHNIDNIKAEIVKAIGLEDYNNTKNEIREYEVLFNKVVENLQSQGKIWYMLAIAERRVEQGIDGEALQIFLEVRRLGRNLIIYKDQKTYDTFVKKFALLHTGSTELRKYRTIVDDLYKLYREEKNSANSMRSKARKIQSFSEKLSKRERAEIAATMSRSMNLLLVAFLIIMILGAIVNTKLAMSIANPIRKLENITKKIAIGDFSETLEVKGKDEISSLEISFNQMEEKLKQALSSLEDTIKQLREKQMQLVEAEKLASIGIFASGIAHEISNPLTSVLTFSNLMLEQTPEDGPNRERLKMMVRETERARDVVRQLLSFGREIPINRVKININEPITEVINSLAAQEVFKDIEVSVHLSDNLPEIHVDPARIGQVVSNIFLNAVYAITPPGRIEVSTQLVENLIEIVFSDTGCGISEENIGRIFDPFFTTKDKTKGTGLGLAVSYGIIKKHGGDIEVQSTVGKGTTFIVRLPVNG